MSPTCLEEFQSFLKKNTPPKQQTQEETNVGAKVVPMASLDLTADKDQNSSASASPVPSPLASDEEESMETETRGDFEETELRKKTGDEVEAMQTSENLSTETCGAPDHQPSLDDKSSKLSESSDNASAGRDAASTVSTCEKHQERVQVRSILSMSETLSASPPISTCEQVTQKPTSPLPEDSSTQDQVSSKPPEQDDMQIDQTETEKLHENTPNEQQQQTASPKPGLSKTVQQAVAGLLMWKSSKQKQISKPDVVSPPSVSNLSPSKKANEPRTVERRITVLTPKKQPPKPFSDVDRRIIEEELCSQLQQETDPLAEDTLPSGPQGDQSQGEK